MASTTNADRFTALKSRPRAPKAAPAPPQAGVSALPVSRVSRIIKADKDIAMCSKEAIFLVSKATEYMVGKLANEAYEHARLAGRKKSVKYPDLSRTAHIPGQQTSEWFYLSDVLPVATTKADALAFRQRVKDADGLPDGIGEGSAAGAAGGEKVKKTQAKKKAAPPSAAAAAVAPAQREHENGGEDAEPFFATPAPPLPIATPVAAPTGAMGHQSFAPLDPSLSASASSSYGQAQAQQQQQQAYAQLTPHDHLSFPLPGSSGSGSGSGGQDRQGAEGMQLDGP